MTMANDVFGEVVFKYDEQQAVEDGVLVPNLSRVFAECDLMTSNLWESIKQKGGSLDDALAYLDAVMKEAAETYYNRRFRGDHDKNFFAVKGFSLRVWFARNSNGKLTALLPEDW